MFTLGETPHHLNRISQQHPWTCFVQAIPWSIEVAGDGCGPWAVETHRRLGSRKNLHNCCSTEIVATCRISPSLHTKHIRRNSCFKKQREALQVLNYMRSSANCSTPWWPPALLSRKAGATPQPHNILARRFQFSGQEALSFVAQIQKIGNWCFWKHNTKPKFFSKRKAALQ